MESSSELSIPVEDQHIKPPESKEKEAKYDPLIQLRRDFNEKSVHLNQEGLSIIDDKDLHKIMGFYRSAVKPGSVLNLGAGTTHLHYMAAIEDQVTHTTALDLGPQHMQVLNDLNTLVKDPSQKTEYAQVSDARTLKMVVEAICNDPRYGNNRTSKETLNNLLAKSSNPDGKLDTVLADMYELGVLGDKKYDNAIVSFSLFITQDIEDLVRLFKGVKEHLTDGGRVLVVDFQGFGEEEVDTDFPEPPEVRSRYHAPYLNQEIVRKSLELAGLKNPTSQTHPIEESGEEQQHDLQYLFASAEN